MGGRLIHGIDLYTGKYGTSFLEDDDDASDSIDGAECDPLVNRTLDNGTSDNDQEDEEEEKTSWRLLRKTMWKFLVTTEFPYMYHRTP